MNIFILMILVAGTVVAGLIIWDLRKSGVRSWQDVPRVWSSPKTEKLIRAECQLSSVMNPEVTFSSSSVMNHGEFRVFASALDLFHQPRPNGSFPFYVFPQVALGQVIRTTGPAFLANEAYMAINSKRCDLLIADRSGMPVAVLEYQGSGHYLDAAAPIRDETKRVALERAGVKWGEVPDGATDAEIQRIIRGVCA